MKTFDWKELLRRHSLFTNLRQDEKKKLIDKFLGDDISTERHYIAKRVILREGESGDSIFIIRSGSVRAFMKDKDGERIIFKKGLIIANFKLEICYGCGKPYAPKKYLDFVLKNSDDVMGIDVRRGFCTECARKTNAERIAGQVMAF